MRNYLFIISVFGLSCEYSLENYKDANGIEITKVTEIDEERISTLVAKDGYIYYAKTCSNVLEIRSIYRKDFKKQLFLPRTIGEIKLSYDKNFLYVLFWNRLEIFDIKNPKNPCLISDIPVEGTHIYESKIKKVLYIYGGKTYPLLMVNIENILFPYLSPLSVLENLKSCIIDMVENDSVLYALLENHEIAVIKPYEPCVILFPLEDTIQAIELNNHILYGIEREYGVISADVENDSEISFDEKCRLPFKSKEHYQLASSMGFYADSLFMYLVLSSYEDYPIFLLFSYYESPYENTVAVTEIYELLEGFYYEKLFVDYPYVYIYGTSGIVVLLLKEAE